ncbi:MAG: peptide ABC transporter substrate-binding protein [Verrucomicrobia bacterium]|nr:peptide ABC transporter substrate-binding protein [Verrucomicrobiota bacterium]
MSGWSELTPRVRVAGLALILAAAAGLALAGCGRSGGAGDGTVLRISQRNEPADLDPARATLPDDFFILRALCEGLVAPDPAGGTPVPAAAESWTVSPDGCTYIFHLRADGRWSDGQPVTAADFVASYHRLLTPANAAPKAPLFDLVRGARAFAAGLTADFGTVGFRAADPRTLVVTLERAAPRFLYYAASGPWLPANPAAVARYGRAWTRAGHFVGNGPFTLAEWSPHQRIVVRRNPGYHAAAHVLLDEIQFIAFDNGDAEERAFRSGQVDVTMAVPFTKLDSYQQDRPDELHRAPLAETRYLAFNTGRAPLNDRRVRQALSLALDRTRLVERVVRGGQEPAERFVPPALRYGHDTARRLGAGPFEDAETARALLAAAGFPGGRGFPPLELSTWTASSTCEAIQAMWRKELGIEVSIATREAKVHLATLREGRYDLAFITAIPDVADAANLLGDFATDAPANYPHWSDAAFDRLLAAAREATTGPAQAARLREAEARLLDQLPATPLYFNTINWLMRPGIQGWRPDPLWTRYYLDLSLHAQN